MNTRTEYKLTDEEKQDFKRLKAYNKVEFIVNELEGTVAVVDKRPGSLYNVAFSHCGANEIFNAKRGKYEALKRRYFGSYAIMTARQVEILKVF